MSKINRESDSVNKRMVDKHQDRDAKSAMVPIFSGKSIIILSIGLIVGLLLGFAYWLISPLISTETDLDNQVYEDNTSIIEKLGIETEGPYKSTVEIQIVNPDPTYMSSNVIRQLGEYYTAMGNSQAFFEFFNQELGKYSLELEYTADDLSHMVLMKFDDSGEVPLIVISAVTPTKEEATFFAGLLPQAFLDFYTAEKEKERDIQYTEVLEETATITESLYETYQQLTELESPEALNNPEYIALKAKVNALQQQFDNQVLQMPLEYYSETELQQEYQNIQQEIETIVTELAEAEQELMDASQQLVGDNPYNADAIFLEAKIRGLQNQLDILVTGDDQTTGLAQLIIQGITAGSVYDGLMAKIDTISQAIAETQQAYDQLTGLSTPQPTVISPEYELAQMKVNTLNDELETLQDRFALIYTQIINLDNENGDTESTYNKISAALNEAKDELEALEDQLGYDSLYNEIEYEITEDKINYLNTRLIRLNEDLVDLMGNVESIDPRNLLVGSPSDAIAFLLQRPIRNVLLLGAILGVIAAWVILNFKWLVKSLSSSEPASPPDEED